MNEVEIKVNNRIDVRWEGGNYRSIVQDTGEGFIAISVPIREGTFLPMRIGENFTAIYFTGSEAYEFDSQVSARKNEGRLPLLYISYPRNVKLVQRREYFRVNKTIPLQIVRITEKVNFWEAKRILSEKKGNQGLILNISGCGIKVKLQDKLRSGDKLLVQFNLCNNEYYLQANIVRIENDELGNFYYGMSFTEVEIKIREKLIQNVFEVERTQRGSLGRG